MLMLFSFRHTYMGDVPHRVVPILSTVLAQRRKHDTVLHRHTTDLERLEKLWDALLALDDQRTSGRWLLKRREVSAFFMAWRVAIDIVALLFGLVVDVVV